jgi:hypothetical protein
VGGDDAEYGIGWDGVQTVEHGLAFLAVANHGFSPPSLARARTRVKKMRGPLPGADYSAGKPGEKKAP